MKNLAEIKKAYPYTLEIYAILLRNEGKTFVSYREKSTPSQGSPSYKLSTFVDKLKEDIKHSTIQKVSVSRDETKITLKTDFGYFQFF